MAALLAGRSICTERMAAHTASTLAACWHAGWLHVGRQPCESLEEGKTVQKAGRQASDMHTQASHPDIARSGYNLEQVGLACRLAAVSHAAGRT